MFVEVIAAINHIVLSSLSCLGFWPDFVRVGLVTYQCQQASLDIRITNIPDNLHRGCVKTVYSSYNTSWLYYKCQKLHVHVGNMHVHEISDAINHALFFIMKLLYCREQILGEIL